MKRLSFGRMVIVAVFLFALMLLVSSSLADTSGTINDHLSWTLSDSGVLTLTGEGSMPDMYYGVKQSLKWESSDVREAVIGDGITTIGFSTFIYHENLEKITIADSVVSIEKMAFAHCNALKKITIPGHVKTIGERAFYYCKNLESITLREGCDEIGVCAFQDCKALSSVKLPESLRTIDSGAFEDCSALTGITLPKGLSQIGDGAFSRTGLKSLTIPQGLDYVAESIVYNCQNLTKVNLHDGIKDIRISAFGKCSNLTSIYLPEGLLWIGDRAFEDCKSLTTLNIPSSVELLGYVSGWTFAGCEKLKSITIPEGVPSLDPCVFQNCTSLRTVIIPASVKQIDDFAFLNCDSSMVIRCYKGSTADTFAKGKGFATEYLDEAGKPAPTNAPGPAVTPPPDPDLISSQPISLMEDNSIIEATSTDNPWVELTSQDGEFLLERKGFIKSEGSYGSYLFTISRYLGSKTLLYLPVGIDRNESALKASISVNYIKTLGENNTVKTIVSLNRQIKRIYEPA